jgi:hypothetical protein
VDDKLHREEEVVEAVVVDINVVDKGNEVGGKTTG